MAYKALKELIQNCVPVDTSSAPVSWQKVKALDDDGEGKKSFKTSLKERLAYLDSQEKRLTSGSGSAAPPTSFKGSISLPVLGTSNEITAERGRDDKSHGLQPCSRHKEEDVAEADSFENSNAAPSTAASVPSRRVKPRRSFTAPVAAVEKIIVDDREDDVQETQSLIHALEDADSGAEHEKDARISGELYMPRIEFEPLVLWPPPGEGSSTQSADVKTVEVPPSINSRLLEHQREGVRFLYRLYRNNHGGILGDDMGLGKTIQSIAFLAAILGKKDSDSISKIKAVRQRGSCEKVVLIMCPTSVLQNWDQEIEAWGDFRVGTYFGLQREVVLGRLNTKEVEIVLTSHDTFRIHGEELCKIKWDCVIVDEAHRLKNDRSQLYMMCMKLPTKRRYGLTGTVMQNTYMELFNVFEWGTPGCLGSRDHFKEYYSGPIKEGQRISAPERFVVIAEDRKKHLLVVLRKYFLRRTKQQTIAHLMNGKEDNVICCEMTEVQRRVYKRILQSPDYQALIGKALPCTCGSPLKRGECCYRVVPNGVIWPYLHKGSLDEGCENCPNCLVLPCLTKLQQVSNHLELIKPNPKDDEPKQAHDFNFARLALGEDADLVGGVDQETSFLGLSDAQHCGKMLALEKLLSSWIIGGDKILLFSYSVKMLDILDKFLIRKGYCFSRLDGSTPMSARQSLVEDFNTSPSKQIFLISTRAGGLGLNLVSANRVLIFDPNWNPSHDLQAQDRSFRFGQVRHVTVYRLLAAGSLEELVYARQIYKQQLFNVAVSGVNEKRYFEGVQGSKQHKGELFGTENLFRDLLDTVFSEGIIEDQEERLLRIQQEIAHQADQNPNIIPVETFGLEEVELSGGDVTCLDTVEPDSTQPVDQDLDYRNARDNNEREAQRRVESALTSAGVLYAHRNEDVVNMGVSGVGVSSRRVSRADSAEDDQVSKDNQERQVPTQQLREKADHCKIRKPSKITHKLKVVAESSARQPGTLSSAGGDPKQLFAELAKFKGLDTTEFSKWLMAVTKEERAQLRLDYQESKQKFSNG